jgi:hypothetical protein
MTQLVKKLYLPITEPKESEKSPPLESVPRSKTPYQNLTLHKISLAHWSVLKQTNDLTPPNCSTVVIFLLPISCPIRFLNMTVFMFHDYGYRLWRSSLFSFHSHYFLTLSSKYSQKILVLRLSKCLDSRQEDKNFRTDWQKTSLEFNLVWNSWNVILIFDFYSKAYELRHVLQALISWDSSESLATICGLDGPGVFSIFRKGKGFFFIASIPPLGLTQPEGYGGQSGRGVELTTHLFQCKGHECVELYHHSSVFLQIIVLN